ncbi:C3H1-type domain-containing protein, partial [Durusdinium trenchii]
RTSAVHVGMYAPLLRPAAAGGRSFMSLVLLAASLGLANVVKSFWGGPKSITLRVRVLWIRHGLSCANVLNACAAGGNQALLPQLEVALQRLPNYTLHDAAQCHLDEGYGLRGRPPNGKDCTVEVVGDSQRFVTKLHHLLLDPGLTDCSRRQSQEAGHALLHFLAQEDLRVHFLASSTLLRAIQTAYHMFVAPCIGIGRPKHCQALANLTVTPIPFVAERSKRQEPLQADNFAAPLDVQEELLKGLRREHLDLRRFRHWPRLEQQYSKFKAFLALLLLPSLRPNEGLDGPVNLQELLEADAPLQWASGSYREGPGFQRVEYEAMEEPELLVALLGHGAMMSKVCQLEASPQNNEVLEKLYILEKSGTETLLRELEGRCPRVMAAPQQHLEELSEEDVASCRVGFDVPAFLDLVACGSTVFGVAVRQLMSVTLYAADPSEPLAGDQLHELVDVNAMLALAASGTASALAGAALSAKHSQLRILRLNGLFMCCIAAFMQWRDKLVREHGPRRDQDQEELVDTPSALVVTAEGHVSNQEPLPMEGPTLGPGNLPRTAQEVARLDLVYSSTPLEKLPRFIVLGALSGALLGYFGVGPAWVIAPLVTRSSPEWKQIMELADRTAQSPPVLGPDQDSAESGPLSLVSDLIGTGGCDERSRRMKSSALNVFELSQLGRAWGPVPDVESDLWRR